MRTRQTSLSQHRRRFRRREEMGAQDQDAAGSTAPVFGSECPYPTSFTHSSTRESSSLPESAWHGPLVVARDEKPVHPQIRDDSQLVAQATYHSKPYAPSPPPVRDHYEELAQLLIQIMPGTDGEELAEAFREGSTIPPITRQSLGELDIQNIISNVKLRHDINFDRDLSFRPNLDGLRGQAKSKATERYWKALVAELELYARLFRGTPNLSVSQQESLAYHVQYRIPAMFETVQEVLRSLVPERDHSRVNEHLDRPMLMQEIERGICDFARLAEWMASLLKEHCAPMRDVWVDEMVSCVRRGVFSGDAETIVDGLRRLFGILETMKLDVANHQIRNLKAILIDDTVNFEKQYHLERLVKGRSRVDIDESRAWFQTAMSKAADRSSTQRPTSSARHLETFGCAILEFLFDHGNRSKLPSSLYLDEDRMHTIKAEVSDLVCLEVCSDVFEFFVKSFGTARSITPVERQQIRTSIVAIMGNAMGFGMHQWLANSEALSLELLRQASVVAGQNLVPADDILSTANDHLLHALHNISESQKNHLTLPLINLIGTSMGQYNSSTPLDLFNGLVCHPSNTTKAPTRLSYPHSKEGSFSCALGLETTKWENIANRITHIILLNWRVWKDIAYVPQEFSDSEPSHTSITQPGLSAQTQPSGPSLEPSVVPNMHTREPLEPNSDSHTAREMRSR